ncbi:mediator of RNA polymerase II transcription subunit 25 [Anabrus simplex]|uniref:mediator of RNA polymerase II transcription subunit 25 n=1 Tax=Anabrus simplex TaxID=316456 RepID=UPI0035A34F20
MNSQPMHLPVSRSWWSCHEFSKHGSARVSGSGSCSTRASSNPAEPNRSWARGNLFKLDLNSLSGNRQQETFSGATDPPSQGPPGRQQIGTVGELHTIWQGVLEWNEKAENPNDPQKLTRHVPCQVSLGPRDGDSDLKADSWPQKLIMQLMPKQLIGNIGGVYLKNSKSVLFHPQQCEALESLTKVMSSGFAGCVHFTGMPSPASCNIKVLILLYTSEKRAYLGFIPNDQAAFVDRLRKVIQHQKTTQALIRQQGQSNERHLGGPGAN